MCRGRTTAQSSSESDKAKTRTLNIKFGGTSVVATLKPSTSTEQLVSICLKELKLDYEPSDCCLKVRVFSYVRPLLGAKKKRKFDRFFFFCVWWYFGGGRANADCARLALFVVVQVVGKDADGNAIGRRRAAKDGSCFSSSATSDFARATQTVCSTTR